MTQPSGNPDYLAHLREILGTHGRMPRTRDIARLLSHAFIDTIATEDDMQKPVTAAQENEPALTLQQTLHRIIDLTYPEQEHADLDAERTRLLVRMTGIPDPAMHLQCMEAVAHIGHLHQMASFFARDALLAEHAGQSPIERLIRPDRNESGRTPRLSFPRVDDALHALAAPHIEIVLTGHPTNTNSIASMQAQRALSHALQNWAARNTGDHDLRDALRNYHRAPLLPQKNGVPHPLIVPEETDTMLYFLNNLYDDIDAVHREYDTVLGKAYGERYAPRDLKLNIKLHSWGSSGDKDGNNNVNGDTTLHAVLAHKLAVLKRYTEDLDAAGDLPPALQEWRSRLGAARHIFEQCASKLDPKIRAGQHLSEEAFASLREEMRAANASLGSARDFVETLYEAQDGSPGKLALLRRARLFGFSLGSIEYRETAEEYQRIVALVIPGYASMEEPQRTDALTSLMKDPAALKAAAEKLREDTAGMPGRPYSPNDARPIAYQTLHRMEIARDFPDMVQNNVLAECQDTSNFLEALLLQQLVKTDDGRRARLGIVPLFEEHAVMDKAKHIVRRALDNEVYGAHMTELSGSERVTQQVQLAHSDNARRAGSLASRGLIFRAHHELRETVRKYNDISKAGGKDRQVELQFFEGGSQSDAYRDGVRAMSAKINEFGLHKFAKFTFQGGDLLNYFNLPGSTARLFSRNISASAMEIIKEESALARHEAAPPSQMMKEDIAMCHALEQTMHGYLSLFYDEDFSNLVDKAGYGDQQRYGNFSSRAKAKGNTDKVNVTNTRTIGLSETFEHAGLVPTWIGALGLREGVESNLPSRKTLSPKVLHDYYLGSAVFRDGIDRLLFGLARSSFTPLQHMSSHKLMPRLREEYEEAFTLAIEAYTGQPRQSLLLKEEGNRKKPVAAGDTGAMRQLIIQEVFPHVKEFFDDQDRLMRSVHTMQALWVPPGFHYAKGATLHNITDTVHHGRVWLLDDPSAAKLHCHDFGIERRHMQNGNGHGTQISPAR